MNKDQTKVILERMDSVQKSLDRIDRDLEADRHDSQEFQIRLGALEQEVKQLREGQTKMAVKVGDKVADAMEPITKTLNQVKKQSWWEKFRKR